MFNLRDIKLGDLQVAPILYCDADPSARAAIDGIVAQAIGFTPVTGCRVEMLAAGPDGSLYLIDTTMRAHPVSREQFIAYGAPTP